MIGDDLDRVMAVMDRAFDPQFGEAWTRRQVEDSLLLGRCHLELIAADGTIPGDEVPAAGFALSRTTFDEEELLLIAVDPAFHGQGLGKQLLNRFAAQAKQRGAKRLLLEMRRGNPAETLYTGFGFAPIGFRPDYYRMPSGARIDSITFALLLD